MKFFQKIKYNKYRGDVVMLKKNKKFIALNTLLVAGTAYANQQQNEALPLLSDPIDQAVQQSLSSSSSSSELPFDWTYEAQKPSDLAKLDDWTPGEAKEEESYHDTVADTQAREKAAKAYQEAVTKAGKAKALVDQMQVEKNIAVGKGSQKLGEAKYGTEVAVRKVGRKVKSATGTGIAKAQAGMQQAQELPGKAKAYGAEKWEQARSMSREDWKNLVTLPAMSDADLERFTSEEPMSDTSYAQDPSFKTPNVTAKGIADTVADKLKHITQKDIYGSDLKDWPEPLQTIVLREIQLTVNAIKKHVTEIKKVNKILLGDNPVAAYNKKRLFGRVKTVSEIQTKLTTLKASLEVERNHVASMVSMGSQIVDAALQAATEVLANVTNALHASNPVKAYNKNFGWFSREKISSLADLTDKHKMLLQTVDYWKDYQAKLDALFTEEKAMKTPKTMVTMPEDTLKPVKPAIVSTAKKKRVSQVQQEQQLMGLVRGPLSELNKASHRRRAANPAASLYA